MMGIRIRNRSTSLSSSELLLSVSAMELSIKVSFGGSPMISNSHSHFDLISQ
jgi:hypothetical protein